MDWWGSSTGLTKKERGRSSNCLDRRKFRTEKKLALTIGEVSKGKERSRDEMQPGFTKPAGTGPVTAVTGLTGPDRFRFRPPAQIQILNLNSKKWKNSKKS